MSSPESLERWERITRDTGMHTVALFSVSDSKQGDRIDLAGTGTLVVIGKSHYILTAAHVWEDALKPAAKMGISLREDVDHKFLIDINTIISSALRRPASWGEWGPDLILLRIPHAHVGTIEAFRVFYGQVVEGITLPKADRLETMLLLGTPHTLGQFTQTHANVQIVGFLATVVTCQTHDGFDFLDVEVFMPQHSAATDFGGVSGGGLWKVSIFNDPSTGKIDTVASSITTTARKLSFWQSATAAKSDTRREKVRAMPRSPRRQKWRDGTCREVPRVDHRNRARGLRCYVSRQRQMAGPHCGLQSFELLLIRSGYDAIFCNLCCDRKWLRERCHGCPVPCVNFDQLFLTARNQS